VGRSWLEAFLLVCNPPRAALRAAMERGRPGRNQAGKMPRSGTCSEALIVGITSTTFSH